MPSCPVSIQIGRDAQALVGRKIAAAACEKVYTGQYDWHAGAFDRLAELEGCAVTHADAHCLLTDGGLRVEFGYNHGDWRFAKGATPISFSRQNKAVSHAHIVTLAFADGAAMAMRLYGWSTHFRIADAAERARPAPLSAEDPSDFTLGRFERWLAERGHMNIVENCSTVKGALDIYNPVMCWILLRAGVHPRSKTRALSGDEIAAIHRAASELMREYAAGERTCAFVNLRGEAVEARNDILWMNARAKGRPCPLCASPIEEAPCAGTKMYVCPRCKPQKR